MKTLDAKTWIEQLEKSIKELNASIEKDFLNAYEWGRLDEKFEKECMIVLLMQLENKDIVEVENILKTHLLSSFPLRESSSSSSNRAEVLRVNSVSKLLKNIGWYTK